VGFFQRKRKEFQILELQLNSLVDIFSTLIFFLLQLFAAGAEGVVSQDIKLPVSISQKEMQAETVVAITPTDILVEGFSVANLSEELAKENEIIIPGLSSILTKIRERAFAWQAAGADTDWQGKVIIQGHKEVSFEIVKRVLATCGKEGFSLISLAVIKGG